MNREDFRALFNGLKPEKEKTRRKPHEQEHLMQVACVRWFRLTHPSLDICLFAVPNGGRRDQQTGAKLKSEGVVAGVADLILLKASRGYHGLLIEMKTQTGRQSTNQIVWQKAMEANGYYYAVCRSIDDFIDTINNYLD